MPKIIWSDSLSVEDEELDNQHKKWIEIFNTSYDKMMGDNYSILSTIGVDALKDMREYTAIHFQFEEQHMENMKYPGFTAHKRQHDLFKLHIERISKDFENGITKLNSEIMKILENWFIGHIQKEDQQYNMFRKQSSL